MLPSEVTVCIPTFNNPQQLAETLVSLVRNTDFTGRILVVNNGSTKYEQIQALVPYEVDWIDAGKNLGWMGALNLGLANDSNPMFCAANDDILFPLNREFWVKVSGWFSCEMETFRNQPMKVGGVGPCSNYVSGYQNQFQMGMPDMFMAPLLIGFFCVYRREAIEDGFDESLPGGDDYDISIRLKDKGYALMVDRRLYVYHHGSQTGRRVHPNYWDSTQHQMETYNALIKKHGLLKWWQCMNGRLREINGCWSLPKVSMDDFYHHVLTTPSDVYEHIPRLRAFAESCESITEFGVDDCSTTAAFMAAKPKKMTCVDIVRKPQVDFVEANANGTDFRFIQASTLDIEIDPTDFLWIDDMHTYEQVKAELALHASKVRKYIGFHDTETLAYNGEHARGGIVPAITEFLREHPEWLIVNLHPNNNGMMILARTGKYESTVPCR